MNDFLNTISLENDLEKINEYYYQKNWGDGLPIIPPTPDRVEKMLEMTHLPRDTVIANLPLSNAPATLELLAINAVMAGCYSTAFPFVVAATKALSNSKLNLTAVQATTNPVAIWVLIGGHTPKALQFNSGINCIGEGNWQNATLGRVIRFILRNIGAAIPGEMDRSTHGQPGRFTFCCSENSALTPWQSFHSERGFAEDETSVTVAAIEGTMNMNSHSKDATELLRVFAQTMIHPPSNEYTHGGEPWLLMGPEHAKVFSDAGLNKKAIQDHLWQLTKMPGKMMAQRDFARVQASRQKELGQVTEETLLPISKKPEEIQILVAGGPGTHSVYLPSFGNSRAVSQKVEF